MKLFFMLALALSPFLSFGQCCPDINSVEVIPSSPTTTDNVKIVTTVTTPNQGMFLQSSHAVNGSNINAEACYYNGLLTATQTFFDTLDIGILSAGNYTVDFAAYQASDTICNYTDTMTSVSSFTVTEQTNALTTIIEKISLIYPNPSSGKFTIELSDQMNASHVRIHSISGKVVHFGIFKKEMNLALETGSYFLELLENGLTVGHHQLLIE
ncbi:MAG: T9SS type A sorting domain-containing protein [Crocinitomicaceae bacterium]|nr:T9SS type A sorting domain-containing protein [Crocinitomicaceae bacterium]